MAVLGTWDDVANRARMPRSAKNRSQRERKLTKLRNAQAGMAQPAALMAINEDHEMVRQETGIVEAVANADDQPERACPTIVKFFSLAINEDELTDGLTTILGKFRRLYNSPGIREAFDLKEVAIIRAWIERIEYVQAMQDLPRIPLGARFPDLGEVQARFSARGLLQTEDIYPAGGILQATDMPIEGYEEYEGSEVSDSKRSDGSDSKKSSVSSMAGSMASWSHVSQPIDIGHKVTETQFELFTELEKMADRKKRMKIGDVNPVTMPLTHSSLHDHTMSDVDVVHMPLDRFNIFSPQSSVLSASDASWTLPPTAHDLDGYLRQADYPSGLHRPSG